ncbi:hypothetical protein [Prosthecobacter sp.]|uniref:hypothetical protein n=1 Tax=Prosthecobacter sp. TaxID=1965333 RepID=UPI001DC5EDEA|nr:hypothetical protein [Prosthecobacter sp.]MCB1277534.1 hypothetical protein [Prosthecobacter sp.]
MNLRHALLLLVLVFTAGGCSTLPQDEHGRRQVYERRLRSLELPVTRARLYKTLRPASPSRPTGDVGSGLLTGSEFYRLDDIFVVEMSVVYKAVAGMDDYLNPAPTIGGQVRSILDATQSIDNFMNRGTPEHPADIIRKARIVKRPVVRY